MNKFIASTGTKTVAMLLLVFMVYITAVGTGLSVFAFTEGAFTFEENNYQDSNIVEDIIIKKANRFYYDYYLEYSGEDGTIDSQYAEKYGGDYTREASNLAFVVRDSESRVLFYSYLPSENITPYAFFVEENTVIECYLMQELTAPDVFSDLKPYYEFVILNRYLILILTVGTAVISILLFVMLLSGAGHRRNSDTIVLNPLDKLPLDLYLFCFAGIALLCATAISELFDIDEVQLLISLSLPVIGVFTAVFTGLCMSIATRIKHGGWWRNTIIYFVLRTIYRLMRAVFKGIKIFFNSLPLIWKGIAAIACVIIAEAIISLLLLSTPWLFIIPWLVFNGLLAAGVVYILISLSKLRQGGEAIAKGNFTQDIKTNYLIGDFKAHADNLNSINDTIKAQVEERMKSERMKTELITNVSHDIKTPLTSIINYTNLLEGETINNPTASEYIRIISTQSERLKKLIVDLVEASKASSGNMTVALERLNLAEAVRQAIGEYEKRFSDSDITVVLECPEDEYPILADGRLLWRILDNLCCNICKYSLASSRAYITLKASEKDCSVCFRNVSRNMLNINPDELMERFVRGDESRSTDGSGLGLSIAKSLAELQAASLKLEIDGDLFKATLICKRTD